MTFGPTAATSDRTPSLPPPGESAARPKATSSGWPLTALLLLYPLWWALGLGTLIVFILAVPMAVHLVRRRPIAVPPAFGLWLLFLGCVLLSTVMLGYSPPDVVAEPASHWIVTVAFSFLGYVAVTIALLYAGNLSEEEFPRRRLVRQLAYFFGMIVVGGLLGIVAPTFEFTSLVELLLPTNVAQNVFVRSLVHPAASQIQQVLGYASPRPAAPFGFTNIWGNCLALVLGFFVIAWFGHGTSRVRRLAGAVVLAVAVVPVVYSLNRGLWIGLVLAVVFVALRLARRGHATAVAGVLITAVVAIGALALTPLGSLVADRIAHPHSNGIRTFTITQTFDAVSHSPVIGLGSTRAALGSSNSIAVGKSASCPLCGNPTLGSTGQLWAVLIGQGYVGALLYVGFFLRSMWVYRRDRSPVSDAGLLAVFLSLWFSLVYNALVIPLLLTFLAVALLWRNKQAAQLDRPEVEDLVPSWGRPGFTRKVR